MRNRLLLLALLATVGCTYDRSGEAARAAETFGLRDVEVVDGDMWWADWHGCDSHDGSWYDVRGTNARGEQVSVVVCCAGWENVAPKACTVRYR